MRPQQRAKLALIAFAFHAPGLKFLGAYPINRRTRKLNLYALIGTLALMGCAAAGSGGSGSTRWLPVLQAWLIGHFGWSICLAAMVYLGLSDCQTCSN